jgi:hypothetical protein
MKTSRGGGLSSVAAVVGPAAPVLIGVLLTILLTISPRQASKNFTAWGEAFSSVLTSGFARPAVATAGGALQSAETATAWFNPGVIVVLIGIAVSLATGFTSAWLQWRATRKHGPSVFDEALHGELLAKLAASHPSSDGPGD